MKRFLMVMLSIFCLCSFVYAKEIEYIYSEWFDYYPEGVEEVRIESQDRYKWYKIENDNRIETEEYYDYLEGYEKILESKKTFYRVINSEYIILDNYGRLVKNLDYCNKNICMEIKIKPFVPKEEDIPLPPSPPKTTSPSEEVIINPDTFDPINVYYSLLIICFILTITINHRKIFLVLSKRWK